jgi:hypothetical protein
MITIIINVIRYNIQSLTGVQLVEHFILFIVVWGTILPIIISQALFSYRDDIIYSIIIIHHSKNITIPSIVTCMIPVLVMSGCLFFIFSVFSLLLKTSFQVRLTINIVLIKYMHVVLSDDLV